MRRRLWPGLLLVLGLVYSVLGTIWYLTHWQILAHVEGHSVLLEMLFRPFWFGVQLIPITIVVALLRVNVLHSILIATFSQIVMIVADLLSTPLMV